MTVSAWGLGRRLSSFLPICRLGASAIPGCFGCRLCFHLCLQGKRIPAWNSQCCHSEPLLQACLGLSPVLHRDIFYAWGPNRQLLCPCLLHGNQATQKAVKAWESLTETTPFPALLGRQAVLVLLSLSSSVPLGSPLPVNFPLVASGHAYSCVHTKHTLEQVCK